MLNVLHLLLAGAVFGAIAVLRREAAGRSLTAGRLSGAPMLALVAAILMVALTEPQARMPALWIGGLASGLAAGAARGIMMDLQVDRVWDRLRLPHARDGLWASWFLGLLAFTAVAADMGSTAVAFDSATAAAAAGCAGYLAGRAGSVWLRTFNAPHSTWRAL